MSKGIVVSVTASTLFGFLYYYSTLLKPLDGVQIFGWRVLLTLPFVAIFVVLSGNSRRFLLMLERARREPWRWFAFVLSSALLGIQLWLFMWAPLYGKALNVSLGYFLLPLTMVLVGRAFLGEHLSRLQTIAVLFASVGVLNEFWQVGGMSWETAVVAGGYPIYFLLRRKLHTDHTAGFCLDMALLLPAAIYYVLAGGADSSLSKINEHLSLWWLLAGLGLISATALMCYIIASRLLPLGLFGLLGYVEPVLLVFVALALGETIKPHEWLTYIPIWLAVGLLVLEGLLHVLRRAKQNKRWAGE